jgi:hypothetical protein
MPISDKSADKHNIRNKEDIKIMNLRQLNLLIHALEDKDNTLLIQREWFTTPAYALIFDIIKARPGNYIEAIVEYAREENINKDAVTDFYVHSRDFGFAIEDVKDSRDHYWKRLETQHLTAMLEKIKMDSSYSSFETTAFYDLHMPISSEVGTLKDTVAKIFLDYDTKEYVPGLDLGLPTLDSAFRGFKPGNLYVIGARPGCGKTEFGCYILNRHCVLGKNTAIFASLEMSKEQLTKRIIRTRANLAPQFFDKADHIGTVQKKNFRNSLPMYESSDVTFLEGSAASTVGSINGYCHKLKPGLVVIDYIQLLVSQEGDKVPEHQKYKAIMQGLKDIARNHNTAVIALAQINRGGTHRPSNSDIKDSGWIEQTADSIFLISRDEHGDTNLILSKNREYGILTEIKPKFDRGTYSERSY